MTVVVIDPSNDPAQDTSVLVKFNVNGTEGWTVRLNSEEKPIPQAFVPATVMIPETAEAEKDTVMLRVLAPAVMDAPAGNVHV